MVEENYCYYQPPVNPFLKIEFPSTHPMISAFPSFKPASPSLTRREQSPLLSGASTSSSHMYNDVYDEEDELFPDIIAEEEEEEGGVDEQFMDALLQLQNVVDDQQPTPALLLFII